VQAGRFREQRVVRMAEESSLYDFVKRDLYVPDLKEVAVVIEKALKNHYAHANVSVVPCPDLTQPPFKLAGLGGSTGIADIGGVLNMEFLKNNNKYHWTFQELSKKLGISNGFWIGAGASKPDCSVIKDNSELIPNLDTKVNLTTEAYVDKEGVDHIVHYPTDEFSSLCNVFVSEGNTSQVLKIELKNRIGETNPVTCMRLAINEHFGPDKQIGLGGVLLIKEGKIKSHVMPGFPPCDVYKKDIKWLTFYEVPAPINCLSVFVTSDKHSDDLRLEHTHFFSEKRGGHYHYDVTPSEVVYEGYYNVASTLYRVGRAKAPEGNDSKL